MFSSSARSLFTSSTTTLFLPHRHLNHRICLSATQLRMSTTTSATASPPETIEHIVLFKVKQDTHQSHLSTMLNGLNSLKSLPMVLHISAGPIHQAQSNPFNFTHMLHSRYRTKDDLAQYSASPAHLDVVKSSVLPICDDIMAVDWVSHNLPGPMGLEPGSAMRVQLIKLKEGLDEKEKGEVFEVIGGIKDKISGINQISFGDNFSPARAKGFSIASIGVFPGIEGLDSVQENLEIEKEKDKGTTSYGLHLRASADISLVVAYFDADWARCSDSRHSTTVYAVLLGHNLIS